MSRSDLGSPSEGMERIVAPAAGEVHLWHGAAATFGDRLEGLGELLSDDERARCRRFRFERHRTAFIVARGMLRVLLARYLDQDPGALHFTYGASGKPLLPPGSVGEALQFNLSHAGDRLIYGFCCDGAVGVDVERLDRRVDVDALARRVLCDGEFDRFSGEPTSTRRLTFLRYWTAKEAVLKARGTGIGAGLKSVELALPAVRGAGPVAIRSPNDSYWLCELDIGPGYAAAIAAESIRPALVCRPLAG